MLMYAYVVFLKDNVRQIVPISDIKDFSPRTTTDFNPTVPVRVVWRGTRNEIPSDEARRYNAQVLKLGETREELETAITAKRVAVPKLRQVCEADVTSQSSGDEETQFDVEESHVIGNAGALSKARLHPKDLRAKSEQDRLKAIIRRHKKAKALDDDDDELETSGGECSVPDKVHQEVVLDKNRYKSKSQQLQKELSVSAQYAKELEKTLEHYKAECLKLRELNYSLQYSVVEAVKDLTGNIPTSATASSLSTGSAHSSRSALPSPSTSLTGGTFQGAGSTSMQDSQSGDPVEKAPEAPGVAEAHASSGWHPSEIRTDVMQHIRAQRSDSLFVKSLAVAIWGLEGLSQRSVTGSRNNRYDSDPKKALTPEKLAYIKDEYRRHMVRRGETPESVEKNLKKVRKFINEKIHDIAKKAKRRL